MKTAINKFDQVHSSYVIGFFLKAFIDPKSILKVSNVEPEVYLFLVKVEKIYSHCVILDYSDDEALFFQAFNDLDDAERFFKSINNLFVN